MKRKEFADFWFGFAIAAAVAATFYWLWRRQQQQMLTPGVVTLGRPPAAGSPAQAVATTVTSEVAQSLAALVRGPATRKPAAAAPDSLQEIKGIGPVYAGRLREAGILTFAQLAAQSPERLAEITRLRVGGANSPAAWIEAARQLAG